ncbi:SMI1/KNR4 family protein [Streptomyces humi]|uniref:SMI1/KNR4 family protein n=1 Tax=Streptomyces humi TaxID=1428620 RepID=UPI00069AC818|nr:SMI1/KNR4 family protein [Streptomyces humi]
MTIALEELLRLVPPPTDAPRAAVDWERVEDELGVRLPDDYKRLSERYGPGDFDGFMTILHPHSQFWPTRLAGAAERAAELLEQMPESLRKRVPYDIDHLLAAGKTDNGDTIYWVTEPDHAPDEWTVTANGARNTKWSHFEGGMVEFLVAILSGTTRLDVFPSDFPSVRPAFAPEPDPETVRRRPRSPRPDRPTPEGEPG